MQVLRGRMQDNDKYIGKDGDLTTWRQKADQGRSGRRTDIVGLKRKVMEGNRARTDLAIEDEGYTKVGAKHSRFAQEMYQHMRNLHRNVCV